MRETATVCLKSRCQNHFHVFLLHSFFGDILGKKLPEMFLFLLTVSLFFWAWGCAEQCPGSAPTPRALPLSAHLPPSLWCVILCDAPQEGCLLALESWTQALSPGLEGGACASLWTLLGAGGGLWVPLLALTAPGRHAHLGPAEGHLGPVLAWASISSLALER